MKAALGTCTSVRLSKNEKTVNLTVQVPLEAYAAARHLFFRRKVLLTLAAGEVAQMADGMKSGAYRPPIPMLHDAVPADYPENAE